MREQQVGDETPTCVEKGGVNAYSDTDVPDVATPGDCSGGVAGAWAHCRVERGQWVGLWWGTLTVISFLRGFFFEVVTYVTARQAFVLAGKKHVFGCVLMALTSLAAVYVSAVNNLGWVMAGHDLGGFFGTLGHVMGTGPLVRGYEFFLAVLLPLSVGAIALVPLDHIFQHALLGRSTPDARRVRTSRKCFGVLHVVQACSCA
jgi:hypothetical protein